MKGGHLHWKGPCVVVILSMYKENRTLDLVCLHHAQTRLSQLYIFSRECTMPHSNFAPASSVSRRQFSKLLAMSEHLANRRQTLT